MRALLHTGFVLLIGVLGLAPTLPAQETDVVRLRDGSTMAGTIEVITDEFVDVRATVDIGGGRSGSAKRQFPMAQVESIDFAPLPGENQALEQPGDFTVEELEALFEQRRQHLHRPRSKAGPLGLLYADRLLSSEAPFDQQRALALFGTLAADAWDAETRDAAREGRLRALIVLRELNQAVAEAKQLAAESEDSRMLIEARYVLATVDFEKLKLLVEDNPKWREDDLVRPEIEALYHSTVDQLLFPYLFHGTEEEPAARGLMKAAEVYELFDKPERARACAEDVVALYSDTPAADRARERLIVPATEN